MIGEIAIGGIFVPVLLVLFALTVPLCFVVIQLLNLSGFYRFVSYRALVDLAVFVLLWGAAAFLFSRYGPTL